MKFLLTALTVCCAYFQIANGHGYMLDPPGRSSAWRKNFTTPVNYNDDSIHCEVPDKQHNVNGGKCGVCGDDYSSTNKQQEPGPGNKYATGTIVATYNAGQYITIKSKLTAYHKGYFEIKLCQNNIPQIGTDASVAVTQSCFDVNLLKASNGDNRYSYSPIVTHSSKYEQNKPLGDNSQTIKHYIYN
ncbi:hypothetical protein EB796_017022 [Bugula neritina]|uniref:Chitin-binding type-4 domain-containing protein n=1 Tax=Bugula neritina TaxID=10212 RepID=A0A7J7JEK3_BUGNE|nr:hypothetical protein EB796_017022 [Bugula neritina]